MHKSKGYHFPRPGHQSDSDTSFTWTVKQAVIYCEV